ncbi:MAG: hypothetical protein VXW27_10260, partial [Pseudomonadota bacterium]|nr:hypothetical protein [Pseudomonadota bacterium]
MLAVGGATTRRATATEALLAGKDLAAAATVAAALASVAAEVRPAAGARHADYARKLFPSALLKLTVAALLERSSAG